MTLSYKKIRILQKLGYAAIRQLYDENGRLYNEIYTPPTTNHIKPTTQWIKDVVTK